MHIESHKNEKERGEKKRERKEEEEMELKRKIGVMWEIKDKLSKISIYFQISKLNYDTYKKQVLTCLF